MSKDTNGSPTFGEPTPECARADAALSRRMLDLDGSLIH
jgi:hypothetical protein